MTVPNDGLAFDAGLKLISDLCEDVEDEEIDTAVVDIDDISDGYSDEDRSDVRLPRLGEVPPKS